MIVRRNLLNRDGDPLIAFFHAQRTGGSEFKRFLRAAFGDSQVYAQQTVTNYVHWGHMDSERLDKYRVYAGHSNYEGQNVQGRNVLPVTILRDPVIRAYSLHRYCQNKNGHSLQQLAQENDLITFYRKGMKLKPKYFVDVQCRRICGKPSHKEASAEIFESFFAVSTIDNISELSCRFQEIFNLDVFGLEKRSSDWLRHETLIPKEFRELVSQTNREDTELYSSFLARSSEEDQ